MWIKAGPQFINLDNIEFVGLGSLPDTTASIYFVGSKNGIDDNLTLHDQDAKELVAALDRLREGPKHLALAGKALHVAREALSNAIEVGLFPQQYHEETRSIIAKITVALVQMGDPEALR